MTLAKAAGISPADANALIKHIKKKHLPEVASYKERFIPGFVKYLIEEQGTDESLANTTANDVWTVILNSASYLFNASHAYAMCLDSLYGAYLKLHYPYEFYATMLKLYSKKGNKEKVSQIIREMKAYAGISMIPGKFGQDNRDWYIDKDNKTISQSLSSIKYISQQAAEDLFAIKDRELNTFTDTLRVLQMETCLDTRQIKTLLLLGYFSKFGQQEKLFTIFKEFFEGKCKLTKTIKSFEKRLAVNREYEASLEDKQFPTSVLIRNENEFIGICLSVDESAPKNAYFVEEIDDKYGIKCKLYSISRGTSGMLRVSKNNFANNNFAMGDMIYIDKWRKQQRSIFKGGKRVPLPDEFDFWIEKYSVA